MEKGRRGKGRWGGGKKGIWKEGNKGTKDRKDRKGEKNSDPVILKIHRKCAKLKVQLLLLIFTDSALWSGSVIESPCMCVVKVVIVNNGQSIRFFVFLHKLDGVIPINNRPSTDSPGYTGSVR